LRPIDANSRRFNGVAMAETAAYAPIGAIARHPVPNADRTLSCPVPLPSGGLRRHKIVTCTQVKRLFELHE